MNGSDMKGYNYLLSTGMLLAFPALSWASTDSYVLSKVVTAEVIAALFAPLGMLFAYRQQRHLYLFSLSVFSLCLLYAWLPLTALGALLVYVPLTLLLWFNYASEKVETKENIIFLQQLCWSPIVAGLLVMMLSHLVTIFRTLML